MASVASASAPTVAALGARAGSRGRSRTSRSALSVRAQAANRDGHNHRAASPHKPTRDGSPVRLRRAPDAATRDASASTSTRARPVAGADKTSDASISRASPRVLTRAAATTSAGFQRTSWYGAVSHAIGPSHGVGTGGRSSGAGGRVRPPPAPGAVSSDASAGPAPDGPGANRNPAVVKQGADQGPPPASLSASTSTKPEAKPYAEPAAGAGELKLPRESATKDAKKKPAGLTRLLRTPLSGASTRETFSRTRSRLMRSLPDSIPSLTHAYPSRTLPRSLPRALAGGGLNSMKDADLPSVAVAARNLMELADYADLSTIMSNMNHRRTGYPFASTVDFATDADGYPIFCLTPLAMHTRNLAYNSRASLTVKMNGWGGLANARVTIFGDVHRLPPEYQASANEIFKAKYEARKEESDLEDRWGDYTFYRMNNVIDVYFVGGFGTLNWVDLNEYRDATPDAIVTPSEGSSVLDTLAELNTLYGTKLANSGAVAGSAGPSEPSTQGGEGTSAPAKVDDLWIISIDKMGVDVRVRVDGVSQVRRINFSGPVETLEQAKAALDAVCEGRVWEGAGPQDENA